MNKKTRHIIREHPNPTRQNLAETLSKNLEMTKAEAFGLIEEEFRAGNLYKRDGKMHVVEEAEDRPDNKVELIYDLVQDIKELSREKDMARQKEIVREREKETGELKAKVAELEERVEFLEEAVGTSFGNQKQLVEAVKELKTSDFERKRQQATEELEEDSGQEPEISDIDPSEIEDVVYFDCPECDQEIHISGAGSHMSQKHDKTVLDYFKVDGFYVDPVTGVSRDSKQGFNSHMENQDYRATDLVVEYGSEKIQEAAKKAADLTSEPSESSDTEEQDDESLECPECGDMFSPKGLGRHMAAASEHDALADYFEVRGEYQDPTTGETYDDVKTFCNRVTSNGETMLSKVFDEHRENIVGRDERYDLQGNLPETRDKKADNMDYGQLVDEVAEYLKNEAETAKTVKETVRELYEDDINNSTYSSIYAGLREDEDIERTKLGGAAVFYSDEEQLSERRYRKAEERIRGELGDRNWEIIKRKFSKNLLPEEGEQAAITYHDFSSEFAGDEDLTPKDAWNTLMSSFAVTDLFNSWMPEAEVKRVNLVDSYNDSRQYGLEIDRR